MKFAPTAAARPVRPAMPTARGDTVRFAFDRASVRQVSAEGHLAVSVANLSAAGVSAYEATEIPGWQSLGLRPGQMVPLLRPPEELAKAAPSLNGRPVLLVHKPVSAEDHPHRLVVGAVGNDVRFEAATGFLVGSLTLWSAEAVEAVKDGSQRALSCGYAYVPVMEGGTYQGVRFAGKMTALRFNHLAIVPEPRVPGCYVGDAALKQKGKFMARDDNDTEIDPNIRSQLLSYLGDILLKEQLDDVTAILDGQTVAAPEMAGDAARRAAGQARHEAAYLRRFPDAARLR